MPVRNHLPLKIEADKEVKLGQCQVTECFSKYVRSEHQKKMRRNMFLYRIDRNLQVILFLYETFVSHGSFQIFLAEEVSCSVHEI